MTLVLPKKIPQLNGEVSPKIEREINLAFDRLYNQVALLINHIEDLKLNQSSQIQSIKNESQAFLANLAIPLIGETNTSNPLTGVGTNPGNVTSVGFTPPNIFTIVGSPITGNGTFVSTLVNQTKNKAWMGPTTGADAAPTFRLLISSDMPRTSSAADPSTTELPNNGDYCCHLNTVSGFVYLAYNKSGSIVKVQLV